MRKCRPATSPSVAPRKTPKLLKNSRRIRPTKQETCPLRLFNQRPRASPLHLSPLFFIPRAIGPMCAPDLSPAHRIDTPIHTPPKKREGSHEPLRRTRNAQGTGKQGQGRRPPSASAKRLSGT